VLLFGILLNISAGWVLPPSPGWMISWACRRSCFTGALILLCGGILLVRDKTCFMPWAPISIFLGPARLSRSLIARLAPANCAANSSVVRVVGPRRLPGAAAGGLVTYLAASQRIGMAMICRSSLSALLFL
jgi:hypothetical protein